MIALAGAIGTGLFLGSGKSIRRAGPAGTLIGYAAVGTLVMSVMGCLAEMSALAPISGAFVRHSEFFVDPALSFAIGWSSFYGSAVSVPGEWSAVAVVMTYWSDLNPGIWIAICIGESNSKDTLAEAKSSPSLPTCSSFASTARSNWPAPCSRWRSSSALSCLVSSTISVASPAKTESAFGTGRTRGHLARVTSTWAQPPVAS
jgi:hypothetical protein